MRENAIEGMMIVHSTRAENVVPILKQGIKLAGQETGFNYSESQFGVIYLSVLNGVFSGWGKYHFIVDKDYTRKNSEQFVEHSDKERAPEEFYEFCRRLGIKEFSGDRMELKNLKIYSSKRMPYQILSLKPIPVEALEALVISDKSILEDINRVIPRRIRLYLEKEKPFEVEKIK